MKKILLIIFGVVLLSVGLMAQTITTIPAGGTWTTARTIINANDEIASDSITILQTAKAPLASPTFTGTVSLPVTWRVNAVTITSNGQELNVLDGALVTYTELNKLVGIGTDTIATRAYARLVGGSGGVAIGDVRDEIADSLNVFRPLYVAVADTATMLSTYALLTEVGEGASMVYPSGSGIPIVTSGSSWGTTITNNSTVWDRAGLVGNGTAAPYFDGTSDGGSLLYFYGSNGFWTALQGGAPTANRSYRLPIAALPSAGTTNLLNIDEYGNMGFVAQSTVGSNLLTLTNPSAITFLRVNANNTVDALSAANFKTALSLTSSDVSLGNVTNESKATMFTSPTFTGVLPKYSTTDTLATQSYARSYGGIGTVTIGDVRDEIADSLNVLRPLYIEVADTASMLGNYLLDSETAATVTGFTPASGSLTLSGADALTFTTIASTTVTLPTSGTLSTTQNINDSLDARIGAGLEISDIAVMLADSTAGPGHYASNYDLTTGLTNKVNVSDTTSMLTHYILSSEVSSTYAPLANPTFTGVQKVSTTDTLATQSYARTYGGTGTVTEEDVEDLITLNARLNIDTIPIFIFGLGSGISADTVVFNNNAISGAFYNAGADTLHITSIRGVLAEGSGTETVGVQISWHGTFKSGSATNLNSAAYTITSITTGDEDTSFTNNEIPPNVWVWCTISAVSAGNKPSLLSLTMSGYKIRNW
jgi:hypothetical protein